MEAVVDDAAWSDLTTVRIVGFLRSIGIPVEMAEVPENTVLPGVTVDRGCLRVEPARLMYPGDLLHEAGHLAVMTPADRASRINDVGADQGEEIAAIAWSWAALTHLGLPPDLVFHPAGYRGAARWFIETFSGGSYPGLPLLQWMGLTLDPGNAAARGVAPFPNMQRWLRAA